MMNKPWITRAAAATLVFLAIFGLFAYFALPGILKSQAEKLVAEKLHRQLSIERIEISPYTLSLDVHGLKLMEPDGKTAFISFENLHVNAELQSLLRLAPVIKEIRLDKPDVHLIRTGENHYNFDDLIALIASQPPSKDTEPARFALHNIQVEGGRIAFDDQPMKMQHVIDELRLGVPFLSSLTSQIDVVTEPLFSARVDGAPLQLTGKATPFAESREANLKLDVDAVDLTRYVGYLPLKPQFKLPSARLDLHLSVAFQRAKEGSSIVALTGTAALNELKMDALSGKPLAKLKQLQVTLDKLNVLSNTLSIARLDLEQPELHVSTNPDGSVNLAHLVSGGAASKAEPTAPPKPSNLKLALGKLGIHGAKIDYRNDVMERPLGAGVDKLDLTVSKISVDLATQTINIDSVNSSSADFALVNGKPNTAAVKDHADKPGPAAAQVSNKGSPGFGINVTDVDIKGWTSRMEDQGLTKPAITRISNLAIRLQNLSNSPGKTGKLDIAAQVNQKGNVGINGDVGLAPLHADLALNLDGVDLMPLQPYVTNRLNLVVTSATVTSKAALKLDQANDGTLTGGFDGDLGIGNLATVDKLSSNDFVRWKLLAFRGVKVQLSPLAVNINQVALDDFFARVIVDPNGRINLQDVAVQDGAEQKSLTEESAVTTPAATPAQAPVPAPASKATEPVQASPMPPVRIRQIALKRGSVRFSDNFIKPNYAANLKDMGGTVSNLSSDAKTNADVDLHGNVNSAPLNIVGRVNPLSGNLFLDVKADVKGMELAPFTPYSAKYVGYGIEKGKLSFDLAYHLENRKLEAQNRVVLDQLTFGEKIDSPTATTLPVQLAVALLRDRNGVIDINLPIGGSLDDPQFSVTGIIFQVIGNLITKAVTSPFALLGSLFGGGEELSLLEFDPGRSTVSPAGEAKLNTLAKALVDRPGLKLDITGRFDPNADRDGLRRAGIERKVRKLKLKQLLDKGQSVDINTLVITPEEYPVLLDKVYKDEDFSKPRNLVGLQKDLPVEEMEKLMMANTTISDDNLITLGNHRAQAVKDWLVKNGQVPAERIFIIAAKSGEGSDKAKANRADFALH